MKWLSNFWRTNSPDAAPPSIPAGIRVYAIGDVHGHHDLLQQLLTKIRNDNSERKKSRTVLILLGDLIDRGPQSAEVVAGLLMLSKKMRDLVILKGNHEEVLLRILDGEAGLVHDWLRFGGDKCMESYGASSGELRHMPAEQAAATIRKHVPSEHVKFISSFHDSFTVGDYLFVHAGIRPGIPLHDQTVGDLRWIRSPFLEWDDPHDFFVVHGHTITEEVDMSLARVGIDTGAYQTGKLTAMGAEGTSRWFLQARKQAPS